MNLQFEDFSDYKDIRKYTKGITNSGYVFAITSARKWGYKDEIEFPEGDNSFYQLMPDSLDEGFFNWYVIVRSKYQFFKSMEMCLIHFVFYYDIWIKEGKPGLKDADREKHQ